jgi:hypothetical protein
MLCLLNTPYYKTYFSLTLPRKENIQITVYKATVRFKRGVTDVGCGSTPRMTKRESRPFRIFDWPGMLYLLLCDVFFSLCGCNGAIRAPREREGPGWARLAPRLPLRGCGAGGSDQCRHPNPNRNPPRAHTTHTTQYKRNHVSYAVWGCEDTCSSSGHARAGPFDTSITIRIDYRALSALIRH